MSDPTVRVPDYSGASLVNLVAEVEKRLTGTSVGSPLHTELATLVPSADTYVLVVFDGLGHHQLDHHLATTLRIDRAAKLDAPFPTTTTVSLASIATGRPPSQHGLIGYQLWLPELGEVANTIKWTTLWGDPLDFDTTHFLPAPNLWERLRRAGIEPITVQPANFAGSKLSDLLYRGCRFEPVVDTAEMVEAVAQLAAAPRRLIVAYLPHVDFAAHVFGQSAPEYAAALAHVDTAWSSLRHAMPANAALVGTADHGHVDFPKPHQIAIPRPLHEGRRFYGDSRAMFVNGDGSEIARVTPSTWLPFDRVAAWWGPGPYHREFERRRPDGVLVADDDRVILHKHSDDRMTGQHGGLTDAERQIPLLVAT